MTSSGYQIGRDEAGLTQRERDVLTLIGEGLAGQFICDRLDLTRQRLAQIRTTLTQKGLIEKTGPREWKVTDG